MQCISKYTIVIYRNFFFISASLQAVLAGS